jgi:hypothetical protein
MVNALDKIKLKSLLKGYKKREIVEEKIEKPKPFVPVPTKGETPTLNEKPINKKLRYKNKIDLKT